MRSSSSSGSAAPGSEQRRALTRRKVQEHRQRLRAQGLRPIQVWVPDVRLPEFAQEARRQCAVANTSAHEADDQAFIDAVSAWPGSDPEA